MNAILPLPVRQIAYFVPDIRTAASAHRAVFGSGPYIVVDHVPTPVAKYRGMPTTPDHGSAYGQWGEVMVEFVTHHDDTPSAFRNMYPRGSGRFGMHHVAIWVDDLDAAIAVRRDGSRVRALCRDRGDALCDDRRHRDARPHDRALRAAPGVN